MASAPRLTRGGRQRMEPGSNPLGGQLEGAFARSIDALGGCGPGTILLFLLVVLEGVLIVALSIRNARTVDMVLKQLLGGDHGESDKHDS
jgi:hypothetical protein